MQLERCLAEEQQQQALLLADATANQNKLLQIVSEVSDFWLAGGFWLVEGVASHSLIGRLLQEQEKLNTGLSEFQQQKDVARTQLVKMLQAGKSTNSYLDFSCRLLPDKSRNIIGDACLWPAEAGTLTLVNKLLNMTERARKTEQLLDEMERDR